MKETEMKQLKIGTGGQTMSKGDGLILTIDGVTGYFPRGFIIEAIETHIKVHKNIGEFSDGYHTFNELYHHRAVLFSVICNMFSEKAWKSKLHDTGDMFDGMFIVGIETEQGQATYHYDIEPYWDMFKVKELEKAPKWDGHTPSDAIQRIGNISSKQSEGEWEELMHFNFDGGYRGSNYRCSNCHFDDCYEETPFCPNCGAKMKGGTE